MNEGNGSPDVEALQRGRDMDESERRCLASIKEGLDQHRDACPMTPRAVYVAGEVYERFGWTSPAVCGVPVRPEDDRPVEWFRVDCPGSAHGVEHHAALWFAEEAVRAADSEPVADPPPYASDPHARGDPPH